MTYPSNDWTPADADATTNISTHKNGTSTAVGSPVSFQAELDLLDTINSAQLVFEAYTTGHLTDLEVVATMGLAVRRKAHYAQVARINRGL